MDDAIRMVQRARQIEPLSMGVSTTLQLLLFADNQFDEFQKEYKRSLGLEGSHQRAYFRQLLALLSRKDADPKEVQAQFRLVMGDNNVSAPFLRTLAGKISDKDAARAVLREAFEDPANRDAAHTMVIYQLADVLDDRDLALAAIGVVIRTYHLDPVVWVTSRSGIRSTPQFKALLREMGVADYFRTSGNWGDFCKPLGAEDFECH
jgi:hypothetical protein